ncbi:MAG TPA: hypothetical protein V6C86_24025 [Oculatellaceae cyanobacterium]
MKMPRIDSKVFQVRLNLRQQISLAASILLLQTLMSPWAIAQNKSSGPSGLTGQVNDPWPWMQVNPDSIKTNQAAPAAPGNAASAAPTSATAQPSTNASSSTSSDSAFPSALTNPAEAAASSLPASTKKEEAKPKAPESKPAELRAAESHMFKEERPTASAAPQTQSKTRTLFGRIEELTAGSGAKFPTLRAQTPTLDLRGTAEQLKASATQSLYSGEAVKSFPADMSGNYGGVLRLQAIQLDPLYYRMDPAEAKEVADLMRVGLDGKVNFRFDNAHGGVALEPAQIFFTAPMTQARLNRQMEQLNGTGGLGMMGMGSMASMPGMGQMMQQMMMSVPYMWSLNFGNTAGTGVSGNSTQTTLVKNEVRQLSPTVIEEQIVQREHDTNSRTGQNRVTYSESVIRFTRYNSSQQYVQAAGVDYSEDKKFLRKMVFAGYVTKGVVEQTSPMGSLAGLGGAMQGMQGMPGMGGAGGMGGLGIDPAALQKLFQGGMPGGFQTGPQIPNLKGLFGQ